MGPSPGWGSVSLNMHYNLAKRCRLESWSNHSFETASQNDWMHPPIHLSSSVQESSVVCSVCPGSHSSQRKLVKTETHRNTLKCIVLHEYLSLCLSFSLPISLSLSCSHYLAISRSLSQTHTSSHTQPPTHTHTHTHMYWSRVRLYLIGYLYGNAAGCMSHFLWLLITTAFTCTLSVSR